MGSLVKTPLTELVATLEVLERFGVKREHLKRTRKDDDYARTVADTFLARGASRKSRVIPAPSTTPSNLDQIRTIMGENFSGVEEWQEEPFGVKLTSAQLRRIVNIPIDPAILSGPCPFYSDKAVKDTHSLFLGVARVRKAPLNILTFQNLFPASGQPRFYKYVPECWYKDEDFAKAPLELRWYLILQNVVPNSLGKTYQSQLTLLPPEYELPTAVAETAKDLLFYQKRKIFLNPTVYGRTSDTTSAGRRVYVGCCDAEGLNFDDRWGDNDWRHVGLAASRILKS